jgi:hypothetical protein
MNVFEYSLSRNIGVQWAGFLYAACVLLIHVAAWLFVLRLLIRHSKTADGWVQYCLRNPVLPLLGILALNLNQGRVMDWLGHLMDPKLGATSADAATLNSWQTWGHIVTDLGYFLVFVYLTQKYLRTLGKTSPEPATAALEFTPSSPEVLAMQSKGLSNPEATFLVQRLHGKDSTGVPMGAVSPSRLWTERAAWMLASVLLFNCVVLPIRDVANLITLEIASWLPVNGHLLGAIALLLQSSAFLLLAAVAWQETTRPKNVFSQFAHIIVKRPLIGTFGFLCLTYGAMWGLVLGSQCFNGSFPITLQENVSRAFWKWQFYGIDFWLDILPVLFVFWLGRQRLNITMKDLFRLKWN